MALEGVKEKLALVYTALEAKYYALMDWLEAKGLKVYEFFVNPIESRGIPSFPVFVLLVLIVVSLLGFAFYSLFFAPGGKALVVSVESVNGKKVDGASVVMLDGSVKVSENSTVGGKAAFVGLPAKLLSLVVSKSGFKKARKEVDLSAAVETEVVKIILACESSACEETYGNATKPALAFEENARLVVNVVDSSSGESVNARVSVYDAVSNVLLTEVSTVSGVAVVSDLEIGSQVYLKAEADGYLAFDGSKSVKTLEAGSNDVEIRMVPLVEKGCAKGSSAKCVTEDGYPGSKTCGLDNAYGECVATPNYCNPGTKISCTTSDACAGIMTCNSSKLYGDCVKTVPACKNSCTPGDELACTTREGFQGVMTCNSNGLYGECERIPIDCTPGWQISCTAGNACVGKQKCGDDKRWGACVPNDASCVGGNFGSSKVIVVNAEDGKPVSNAFVSVYVVGSSTPLIKDKVTDKNGSVVFNLSTENASAYFAVASKQGFFEEPSNVFYPGENVEVMLEKKTTENSANLSVRVVDVDSNPVPYALVALFRKSVDQPEIVFQIKSVQAADETGIASFNDLKKGSLIIANATLDAQHGSAEKVLSDQTNSLDVQLELPPASITIQATNLLSGAVIEDAEFKAFFKESELSACASPNCTLSVKGLYPIRVEASAPGFSPKPYSATVTLHANENAFLNALLIDDDDVNGSIAVPSNPFVVDAVTGFNVTALKPGHTYSARFQLVTREDAELEQTGFHFSLEPQGIAAVSAFKPFAPQTLGGVLDETLGCGDASPVNASSGLSLSWLDLTFQGAKNLPVEVNFTVSTTTALDPVTHQGILSLKARSFAVNNSQWVRNPFDENYSVSPGEILESGCNAKSDYYNYLVTSLGYSCNELACVFVKFIQAGREGFDGFEASDLKQAVLLYLSGLKQPQATPSPTASPSPEGSPEASPESSPEASPETTPSPSPSPTAVPTVKTNASALASSNLTPLIVSYSVEVFKPLAAYSGMAFQFNETDLKIFNASTPLPPEGFECKNGAYYVLPDNKTKSNLTEVPFDAFKNPLVFDYSRLRDCYDYPPLGGPSKQKPYSFSGVLYALPWSATEHSDFKTFFATAESPGSITPENTVTHESWLKIIPAFPAAPPLSLLTLLLSQTQNGALREETIDSSEPFNATPINASEPFIPLDSNTSLVSARFNAVLQRNAFDNVFSLEVPDCKPYCRAALKVVGVEYGGKNYTRADGTEFDTEDGKKIALSEDYSRAEIRAGDLSEGDEFNASFLLAPLSIEVGGLLALSQIVLKHEAREANGTQLAPTQRQPKTILIPGANVSTISYFAPGIDNCGGAIHVNYNTAVSLLNFQQGCTDLGFRITPILPADAVFTSVNSTVTLLVKPIAGDLNAVNCFESCSVDDAGNVGGCAPGFSALTNTGSYVLRYNTESASCPEDFKLVGTNKLRGAELTLTISAPGVPEEFAKKLKIHVVAETKQESLYVAPIYVSYSLKSKGEKKAVYPQVWSVVNHKQIGSRRIVVAEPGGGELEFAFDGPGTQFFAFAPTGGAEGIKVYEIMPSGSRKLVLDSENGEEGALTQSEYFEALKKDSDKRFVNAVLDCDENDSNCVKNKQRFAEYNAKSKQLSNEFLKMLSGNEPFNKNIFQKIREKAKKIANTTVFWRSFQQQLYCRNADDNGVPCVGRSTDPACCRGSIYDWVNVTTQNTFGLQQCVFCNNTWRGNPPVSCEQESEEYLPCTNQPIAVFNCDQRCTPEGIASVNDGDWIIVGGSTKYCEASKYKGITSISEADVQACKENACPIEFDDSEKPFCYADSNGNGFIDFNLEGDSIEPASASEGVYSCANGKKIAVSKECVASCDNWCIGRTECDYACGEDGVKPVETGSQEVLGETPAGVKLVTVKLDSSDPAYQKYKLLPRKMFSEYGDPSKFLYHYSINSVGFKQGKAVSLKQELGLSEVKGCSETQKYVDEGSFLITQENVPDVGSGQEEWLSKAEVITIPREKYLGEQCLKNDAKWNSVALCAPLYVDNSPLYGACINNLALLAPELLETTFFEMIATSSGKPLFVYPVDSGGVIQGDPNDEQVKKRLRGFFLSERGYAVAFRDSKKEGHWYSTTTITQDFDYWNPVGKKGQAQLVWKTPWWKKWLNYLKYVGIGVAIVLAFAAFVGAVSATQTAMHAVKAVGKWALPLLKSFALKGILLKAGIVGLGFVGWGVWSVLSRLWSSEEPLGAGEPCMPGEARYALIDSLGDDDFENSDIGVRGCQGRTWQACTKNDCSQNTKH